MDRWIDATGDQGMQPEKDYLASIWPDGQQPKTDIPVIEKTPEGLRITRRTEEAAIGYQWVEPGEDPHPSWLPYQTPLVPEPGKSLIVMAHRIGYLPSETTTWIEQ